MSAAMTSKCSRSKRMGRSMARERNEPYVQALDRGLAVLRCFGEDRALLTISDVAREVHIDRAAARRFLHTLVSLGYVGVDGGRFYLRPRVLELAQPYLDAVSFPDAIQPHLEALTREISETSMAFVLDGDEIVYVAGVQAKKLVVVQVGFGTRVPAYASPVGRVLLAALPPNELDAYFARVDLVQHTDRTIVDEATLRLELEQIADHGYAIGDQELAIGLRTVAVPVHDKTGKVIAAISIGVTAATVSLSALSGSLLQRLKSAAVEIEADLKASRHTNAAV